MWRVKLVTGAAQKTHYRQRMKKKENNDVELLPKHMLRLQFPLLNTDNAILKTF